MRGSEDVVIDVGALLEKVDEAAPIDAVEVVAAELGRMVDAREVTLLIADFSGRAVVRMTVADRVDGTRARGVERAEVVPLAGTRYERVLRTQQADIQPCGDGARLILPVTDRGDAIGLLKVHLPRFPSNDEIADISSAAHALGYVIIAARRHTDVFEWGQRSTPFALAAEIQRRLLPASYTCEAGQFTIAGWLEPAASVGGDTFDYTLDRGVLQLSITDAVGATRFRRRWSPRCSWARCAMAAGEVSTWSPRPDTPTTHSSRTPLRGSSSPDSCCASTCTAASP